MNSPNFEKQARTNVHKPNQRTKNEAKKASSIEMMKDECESRKERKKFPKNR